jgi:hypothetical protein
LQQELTYEGLLEGLPTTKWNRRIIEAALARTAERTQETPWLFEPVETPIAWSEERPYPFGEPSSLPGVLCVGEFASRQHDRSGMWGISCLTIVWFQDEWALPIDPSALEAIQKIDWNALAKFEEL